MQAEWIDLPAASVDGVICRFGYMLLLDPEAALRETRRVLRPGGRVALAAWTSATENPWASIPIGELVDRGHVEAPQPGMPGQYAWGRPGTIEERLGAAGFAEPEVDTIDFAYRFDSFDDWIATQRDLSMTFSAALAALDAAERDDVLVTAREKALPYVQEDGSVVLPARTWVAAASA
jgi:SAM-dependent methyltransferase